MKPITTSTAARILEKSEGAVRQMGSRGELTVVRTETGMRLFDRDQVERIAGERRTQAQVGRL